MQLGYIGGRSAVELGAAQGPGATLAVAPHQPPIGEHEGEFAQSVLRHYLHGHLAGDSISCPASVVLGCTHFPVFKAALRELLPATTQIVDSAATTAARVRAALGADGDPAGSGAGALTLLATDGASRFRRVGSYFLGAPIEAVELVDL